MRPVSRVFLAALLGILLAGSLSPAEAQFGKLKDKVKKKAEEKATQTIEGKGEAAPAEQAAPEAGESAAQAPASTGGSASAEDMALYTKFDFVPGDKVLFYDDLAAEELGEFPSRWGLEQGVFEIAKAHGRNWILCTDAGAIYPKVAPAPLPQKYTVEFDLYINGGTAGDDGYFELVWFDASGKDIAKFNLFYNTETRLYVSRKEIASKQIAKLTQGIHTMRVMATKSTLKCFVDGERVANVPAIEGFAPVKLGLRIDPYYMPRHGPMLVGNFRYAEGGKTMKEQLDEEGRIVTHGILFDSGSAKIKGESYKTLADIGALLSENPSLRLSIEGHTDSDGADDFNLELSQDRSASVRTYLVEGYKIDAGRLEAKGWGESKPIDTNNTAEGKANNRRVELVKL